jgi:triphosphoribosyl-dephospho-CoA synthase
VTRASTAARARPAATHESAARAIARIATRSLWAELALYPKPGLVSLRDAGAHDDMDASTFVRSLFTLRRYFAAIAAAGCAGAPFEELRRLGIEAESAMLLATGGVNTHRGSIFALGILCAAAGRAHARGEAPADTTLRRIVTAEWGGALVAYTPSLRRPSHGARAAMRYGVSGARGEAKRAFPSVFEVALPALREAIAQGFDPGHAALCALFALYARVDDTNVLHRAGAAGLAFVQQTARAFRAAGFLDAPDALARAEAIHREFVARRLSPGGCADLLAAALFVQRLQQEETYSCAERP